MLAHRGRRDVAERRVIWAPWSPAQIVALAFGIFFLALGAVTLSRAGGGNGDLTSGRVVVWSFGGNAITAIVEIVYGLLLILAGAVPGAGRATMAFLGVLALGAGIITLAARASLYDGLGVNEATGWLFLIAGIANLIAAMAAPVFFAADRESIRRDDEVIHEERF
jgi:hypothetical protein